MEGDEDGDGDDGHVGREAEPGEKSCVWLECEFVLIAFYSLFS